LLKSVILSGRGNKLPEIFANARLRASPFYEATVGEGLSACTLYNSMLLPTSYGDPEGEYWRLIEGVSQWDVSVERQVQIEGHDAGVLAQILCARDLSKQKEGQGKYVAICNHSGTIINDPICLKLSDTLYWMSIADSDMWLWARAIAAERKLDVQISQPDVSPMAVQGPKAEDVVAHLLGDWVRDVKYFWFNETHIEDIPVVLQRSGWSKQGGFEIYLRDKKKGMRLWNIVREAGEPWGIGPGHPATAERTESGLVSVGGDTDQETSPFDIRMEKYVDTDVPDDVIGIEALRLIQSHGSQRQQLGVVLEGEESEPLGFHWEPVFANSEQIGHLTNAVWSPRLKQNIGYVLISKTVELGERVLIKREMGDRVGTLVDLPFL